MARQYFGTDGIRGRVGQSPITPDFVLRLAHAVGRVLRASEADPVVLIGKDTRISGYMLESALESGFNSAGVDVVLLGPVPTPAVAYLTRAQRAGQQIARRLGNRGGSGLARSPAVGRFGRFGQNPPPRRCGRPLHRVL